MSKILTSKEIKYVKYIKIFRKLQVNIPFLTFFQTVREKQNQVFTNSEHRKPYNLICFVFQANLTSMSTLYKNTIAVKTMG
jgi:hypothetical protein